ncbi:MAG: hypothetical protein HC894_29600 [Microcoleus sp. SM1_3_4]|nr:hypothetical protein [Microcoleus sp. SM1_3_4]
MTIAQTAASYYRSLDFDELDRGCGSMSSIALALQLRSDRIFCRGDRFAIEFGHSRIRYCVSAGKLPGQRIGDGKCREKVQ